MHRIMLFAATAALCACTQDNAAEATNDATEVAADANAAAGNAADAAAFSLNETTWTFTEEGKPQQISIDANGAYVTTSGAEHVDHGTVAMTDGKACFTSAMNKDGPECWTVQDTAVGSSYESTSDKGQKLTVSRVAYVPAPPAS